MAKVAEKHQERLKEIKKKVENAHAYFKENYYNFNKFMGFVFDTTMSEDEKNLLQFLKKPQIEFNTLEAYISRLRGEFFKQEPSVEVTAGEGLPVDSRTIQTVEGYFRHVLREANNDGFEYKIYTDLLAGGFSAIKIWTEYANEMSFNQVIKMGRVYDPCLTYFDPLAQKPHKGDGRYCGELYPKTKDEVKEMGYDINFDEMKFAREENQFSWSYKSGKEDIVLLCDHYEKKIKRKKIVKLATGQTMTLDDYKNLQTAWNERMFIQQVPAIVEERWANIEVICRYRIVENQVLEYIETDFKYLPVVFVDGNSVLLRKTEGGEVRQKTRPYIYNAIGAQKLKNFAGQTLAAELENLVMHKWKAPKEGIPEEYKDAYINPQQAQVLVYNSFKDNDPNVPLQPPQEIARVPAPPEVTSTFTLTDGLTQTILGSYDASLGINNNQLSGVAIVEGATQSNATSMPYVVGFLQGLNQAAQIIIDLIPKYIATPRTIPVMSPDGKKSYVKINNGTPDSVDLFYDSNALQVNVEAGVNFAIQKSRALQQIVSMMQSSQLFAQFMNQEGLEILVDNLEIRGADQLKEMAQRFMQKLQAQQEAAAKAQAQQPNPLAMRMQLEQQKFAHNVQQDEIVNQQKAAELAIDQQQADSERMRLLAELQEQKMNSVVQLEKAQTEKYSRSVDLALKDAELRHRHALETAELHHKITSERNQNAHNRAD